MFVCLLACGHRRLRRVSLYRPGARRQAAKRACQGCPRPVRRPRVRVLHPAERGHRRGHGCGSGKTGARRQRGTALAGVVPDRVQGLGRGQCTHVKECFALWVRGGGGAAQVMAGLGTVTVNLHCPRFEAEQTSSMADVLKGLGVHEAFTDAARFGRMTPCLCMCRYVTVLAVGCVPPPRHSHAHPDAHIVAPCFRTLCCVAMCVCVRVSGCRGRGGRVCCRSGSCTARV